MGRMGSLGLDLRNEAMLGTLTQDVLKSSEIEGEVLEAGQVRSSIARGLGMEIAGSVGSDSRSGMYRITVGGWRKDTSGPMQVVSGAMGKEKVHFQAPAYARVNSEMQRFLDWFDTAGSTDPALKAAVAHPWFITIHPFADGNGRMARALTDMLLARADGSSQRFYGMSARIRKER